MKTGCTSGKKNFVFTFHSVCTVFVPFKMKHFQLSFTVKDLHNYKGVPYEFHMDENRHKRMMPNYHFPFIYGLLRGTRYNGGTRRPFRERSVHQLN